MGHRQTIIRADRALGLAVACACALILGGCGGVQFEGKVFDYMGISGDRQEGDVRMSERPPLLLPPNSKALPQPGAVNPAASRQDWPDDPERVKKRVVAEKKAQENKAEAEANPLNPMAGKPTLLDKVFAREKTEEAPIADVPEPDPSDRVPEERSQGVASSQPPLTPHVPHTPIEGAGPFEATGKDTYGRVSNPTQSGQPGVGF
ncbi:MAG: hypothetical protein FJX44_07430 [Alphaproteobacteria bacterium]|nr:hypothetical protein [Alphaproteobacteria bacterium]